MIAQILQTTALNSPNVWLEMEVMSVRKTLDTRETAQCAPVEIVLTMFQLHFCFKRKLPQLHILDSVTVRIIVIYLVVSLSSSHKKVTGSAITSSLWSRRPSIYH